jgi:hypothetical protein
LWGLPTCKGVALEPARLSFGNQLVDEHDDGDHEKQVDEIARYSKDEAAK